jgi:TolB-like protein
VPEKKMWAFYSCLACIAFLLSATAAHPDAEKMRLAVMEFKADGVSRSQALRVSELIRTAIINTGNYTVLERTQMDMILREQGFQQAGIFDDRSAARVGRILSTQKILVGTVMKLGSSIVISGRIVDVEKGSADKGANEEAASEDELLRTVTTFCEKLTGSGSDSSSMSSDKPKVSSGEKTEPVFNVGAVQFKTNKKVYAAYEQITIEFSNLAGTRYEWFAISKPEAPPTSWDTYSYTGSQKSGSVTLRGLAPGTYNIRFFYNWDKGKYDFKLKGQFRVSGN